ncbi:imidazole glycerol phosphate synthase subunit HisH [Candidatus Chloroploca sp. Khr17]|uniref:imidazole glycerol phosphate synthase subunit HisH n=1 Tax=Candidatus Chloroploca sp. Khr17 TaxID=2496869 RepID=UPI00101BC2B3|nr:imidazole glycerol phosphate synthase subunit HisH [Candidatus Chloroploca sp. Khr17]
MNIVAIIDYDMGNLDSVSRAVEECGGSPLIITHPHQLSQANRIILPGVGSFKDAISNLHLRGFVEALAIQVFEHKIPFLGICLGMQLLATTGWEGGETPGLGWIDGEVQRLIPTTEDRRIPHIGWNEVHIERESHLFKEIRSGCDFYFVHSYHFCPYNSDDIVGRTPYASGFASVVQRNHIYGVQFHPEKSQRIGFQVLRNFLTL